MNTKEIPISEITANADFMMRKELDKSLVAQYKEILDTILVTAPIQVYHTGNGNGYLLTDGFHRLAAARQLNMETIRAIINTGTIQDAYAAACLANLKHGKPLSRDERRLAIEQYIKLFVTKSDRSLAQDVGISHVTIMRYRANMEAAGEIEPQEKRVSSDGIIQSVNLTVTNVTPSESKIETPLMPPPDPYQEWFDSHVKQGDSLEILSTLSPRKFDLAIVDPPYGITTEKWDLTNKHELLAFTRRWLNQTIQLLKPTGRLYIFWSREYMFDLKPLLDEIIETYPLHFGGMMVWYFRNVQSQPDNRKKYKLGWEPIFYYYGLDAPDLNFQETEITGESWKGKGEIQSDVWTIQDDVFTFAIPQSNFTNDQRVHPTQKPRELYERIIETATITNDSILDPFGGSGTTGHAAMLKGRDFILIEQNDEYINEIYKRLRKVWTNDHD